MTQIDKAKEYVFKHARLIDQKFLKTSLNPIEENVKELVKSLEKYQNKDGGFGHGIEPDIQMTQSSVIASTVGLQYLSPFIKPENTVINRALEYLAKTYNNNRPGWLTTTKQVNQYPHAPWWHFDEKQGQTIIDRNWGNPTAEVLGYFLKYSPSRKFVNKLTKHAFNRIKSVNKMEMHELICFIRLYENSPKDLKVKLYPLISKHLKNTIEKNPAKWSKYTAPPLFFIKTKTSDFYPLIKDLIKLNIEFILKTQQEDGSWLPSWNWREKAPSKDWLKAKKDWIGFLTVKNILLLNRFVD